MIIQRVAVNSMYNLNKLKLTDECWSYMTVWSLIKTKQKKNEEKKISLFQLAYWIDFLFVSIVSYTFVFCESTWTQLTFLKT